MSSILNYQSATTQAGFGSIVLEFTSDLRRQGIAESSIAQHHPGPARHFLIWLERSGIVLDTVDCTVIDRFLQHDCDCCSSEPTSRLLHRWRKRERSSVIMRFVRFLERTGRIETPGDLDDNLCLLDGFLECLRGDGYGPSAIRNHKTACTGLIVWLHFSRIRLRDLNPEAYARFRNRRFNCSIPGVFWGRRIHSPGDGCDVAIRKFLRYLVAIGHIEPLEPVSEKKAIPESLKGFSLWLERNRGIRSGSIGQHTRLIASVLPVLGDDPRTYDAALIRRVLFEHIQHRSRSYARNLATSVRMYLRFLVSEGSIVAALVEAVPTVPEWRLSALPRYISADDVERSIAACGDDPMGIRDRAILLLLARLALRAGDIVALGLDDIDWDRAELLVAGKSRRQTALPLPQDAGDALYTYIAKVRPRVRERRVFLCVGAPHRPFACSTTVSSIARRALDRAGVTTFASRGAHVFRHSQATELLRSGATLDVIQSLLRHASADTTMIYAKTDVLMLLEVAQPWIGGNER